MIEALALQGTVFISRAGEDRDFAARIDVILRGAGFKTYVQDEDFGHASFMEGMAEGFRRVEANGCLVALLSESYQRKPHCLKEARYPLIDDPMNKRERLVVLRVDASPPRDFLKDIPYVDLLPYLDDPCRLEELVLGSVGRALRVANRHAETTHETGVSRDPRIERLTLYLENEDQAEHGKNIVIFAALMLVLGLALIAFDYAVSAWNHIFGTSYYAIFDTSFVVLGWIVCAGALLFGVHWQVRDVARTIENAHLTPTQLRILRTKVSERAWRSKWLIDAAISTATRNITARR